MRRFKKVFLWAVALWLAATPLAYAQPDTLWGYYLQRGEQLPSVQERAVEAAQCGIFFYEGTFRQNVRLLDCLLGNPPREGFYVDRSVEGEFGANPVTRYQTTLSQSVTSSQNTIPVSSVTTFDGTTLTADILGAEVFLSIEPGSSREEIVRCTGISSTTFTGCNRGLAFSGNDTSEVAANKKAHNAGSVVIMSNVHYVYTPTTQENVFTETQRFASTTAPWQLYVGDGTTGQDKRIGVFNGDTNLPYLGYDETNNKWIFSNDGTSSTDVGGGTGSITAGNESIDITSGEVRVNTTTPSGLELNGGLQINASSTKGIAYDANGLYVDESDDYIWTGTQNFDGATVSGIGLFGGGGGSGALNVTSGTTTISTYATTTEYTSINIDAGAVLTFGSNFQNKVITLKSQGACTINGTINVVGLGGTAGSGGAVTVAGTGGASTTVAFTVDGTEQYYGGGGSAGNSSAVGSDRSGGAGAATSTTWIFPELFDTAEQGYHIISPGSGGGGGGGGNSGHGGTGSAGGNGGAGGGALILQCAGNLTFGASSEILAYGLGGSNGTDAPSCSSCRGGGAGAGGGGGAGGHFLSLYDGTLTDNGVTVDVSGGTGGTGGTGYTGDTSGGNVSPATGGGGGGGGSSYGRDHTGGIGSEGTVQNTAKGGDGGTGGTGGTGKWAIIKNIHKF